MGDVRSGRGVGGRTHTGLVGIQAALNALHHAGAGEAAENGGEIKGAGKNVLEDGGDQVQVHQNHDQGNDNVENAHDGNQCAGDFGQTVGAAQHAGGKENRQDQADEKGGMVAVEAEAGKGGLEVVGGQHIISHRIGQDNDDGEDDPKPALPQGGFHVVGGTAVAAAVLVLPLIDLGQGGLHKGGGAAQNGGDPHPEHRAVSAQADGSGDPDNVAGAHPGGGGDHQGAEGGNASLGFGLFRNHPEGLAQQANLDKLAAEGKE